MKTISLQVELGQSHWTMYTSGTTYWRISQIEAAIGDLPVAGFRDYQIVDISDNEITIEHYDEKYTLTPGETVQFSYDIEGREWSDGCVYDGDTYTLKLTWGLAK